jgi:pimeloyl-ACP methyl ester carboxylesterase
VTWRTTTAGGARTRWLDAGDGDPLVFLHGWGLSPRAYVPALRCLAHRGHRVTAPSLPGFGFSAPRRNGDHSLHGMADHMIEALDALGLPDRLPVVAHSFGAGVSLRIAAVRPDLVSRLTLISPVGGAAHGPVPWPSLLTGMLHDLKPRVAAAGLRELLAAGLRNPAAITASGLAARAADSVADLQAAVAAAIPVRLVFAAADRVVRPGDLPICAPRVTTETVQGSHGWLLREPRRFAELVTAFPGPLVQRMTTPAAV